MKEAPKHGSRVNVVRSFLKGEKEGIRSS